MGISGRFPLTYIRLLSGHLHLKLRAETNATTRVSLNSDADFYFPCYLQGAERKKERKKEKKKIKKKNRSFEALYRAGLVFVGPWPCRVTVIFILKCWLRFECSFDIAWPNWPIEFSAFFIYLFSLFLFFSVSHSCCYFTIGLWGLVLLGNAYWEYFVFVDLNADSVEEAGTSGRVLWPQRLFVETSEAHDQADKVVDTD